MAMLVLVLETAEADFCVRHELVSELGRLGVTNVTLVRDQNTVGVVLEGWLFDPLRSARAVAQIVGAGAGSRTLHPVMHMAVTTAEPEGGRNVHRVSPA